ncbi:MAG TPA: hypothetical protein VMV88_11155 [Gallionella sp.]|nr:hypothetical protein [Gallionella sp.]
MSNTSDNSANDTKGTLLVVAVAIIAIIPLLIGYWASQTGGGL